MGDIFFHVDMDAFFASIEQQDRQELIGRPVIVGADPRGRGVVAACSYEARKYGIHSAMPISAAYKRCPHAVFLPIRMARYQEISRKIMQYLHSLAPKTYQVSVDEAFLDYSGTERLLGKPVSIAARLKEAVFQQHGLHISIGIGPNPYIAKLASAASKPNGLLQIFPEDIPEFIDAIPLRKMWGIGPKTTDTLLQYNIDSVSHLRATATADLAAIFGEKGAVRLSCIARGEDPGIIHEQPQSRSISIEHTFMHDISSRVTIREKLFELCTTVMFRVMHEGCSSSTVVVRVRSSRFETHSAQKTLGAPINSSQELYETALGLIEPLLRSGSATRLIGVGLGQLQERSTSTQSELFSEKRHRLKSVEAAILDVQRKYGIEAITKAKLIRPHSHEDERTSLE